MIVGRTSELAILDDAFARMLAGCGSVLFLTGEAGLGKTTLAHAWWQDRRSKDAGTSAALFGEAACSIPIGNVDVGVVEALQPWADVVAHLNAPDVPTEVTHRKINMKRLVHEAAPAWAWALPFVGDIAHAAVVTSRLVKEQRAEPGREHYSSVQSQQQVFQQYVNLLSRVASGQPLVILLDDMHSADTSSTNLLFYLSRQITTKRILAIVTYRPDEALDTGQGANHPILKVRNEVLRYDAGREVQLGYLGNDAIRELLTGLFPGYAIDDTLERWLRTISDGNSLFVTQFLKTLREDGHLDDAGCFRGSYSDIAIPPSTLAVVAERTRRLDADTRQLLCYATAEGEEFTSYVLGKLTEKNPLQLLRELKAAQRLGIVHDKGQARIFASQITTVFGFSHALFHRALYESLGEEERALLHRACYDILKGEWDRLAETGERTPPLAAKLLTHAEKCEEWDQVAAVGLETARKVWLDFSEAEALEMTARVLGALERSPTPGGATKAETLLLRARIHLIRGRHEEALIGFTSARDLFFAAGLNERAADAWIGMGATMYRQGAYVESLAELESALERVSQIPYRKGEAWARNSIGLVHWKLGAHEKAMEYHRSCLPIWEDIGERDGLATSLNNIGIVHVSRGEYEEAMEYYLRSVKILEEISDRAGEAASLLNIGLVHANRGAYAEAMAYYRKGLAIAEDIGHRTWERNATHNMGLVHASRDAHAEAMECFRRTLTLCEEIGDRPGTVGALKDIAVIHRKRNELAESRAALERALASGGGVPARSLEGEVQCELGLLAEAEAALVQADERAAMMRDALERLQEGVRILEETGSDEVQRYRGDLERLR